MRDIILNLSEQTLSKIGSCDYSNIVTGKNGNQLVKTNNVIINQI